MIKIITFLILCNATAFAALPIILYGNDFDTTPTTSGATTGTIYGGTATGNNVAGGITYGQLLDGKTGFSNNIWRITAEDDKLIIQISNLDPTATVQINFSLAMLDSWDGTSSSYGSYYINMEIYDGGTVMGNDVVGGNSLVGFSETYNNIGDLSSNPYFDEEVVNSEQLGFNYGTDTWWFDDAMTMEVPDLQANTGTLTFVIYASSGGTNPGFQGGDDESFGIDGFYVSTIPEPSTTVMAFITLLSVIYLRKR